MHRPKWRPLIWRERLGPKDCPYLVRWVLDAKLFSVRLHRWIGSDDDRYVHDHPWDFVTVVLKGCYFDEQETNESRAFDQHINAKLGLSGDEVVASRTGSFVTAFHPVKRKAAHAHSVQLASKTVWSVLVTGRHKREWGFWVDGKWVPSRRFFREVGHPPCDD